MRSLEKRFIREINPKPFADEHAMSAVEGRRHPKHDHDHMAEIFDPEPWADDLRHVHSYRPYLHRVLRKRGLRA